MKELELIRLYFYLCECNDKLLWVHTQRFSRNAQPNNEKLTDVELLTIYLYSRRFENRQSKREIWDYAQRYLSSWFPNLPAYATFNHRLNQLSPCIPSLVEDLLQKVQNADNQSIDSSFALVDSLPIMLCSSKRRGKVAPELSQKSFCGTKGIFYYGVKLHTVATRRAGKLPVPEYLLVTSADTHDFEALRDTFPQLHNRIICADKAYANPTFNQQLLQQANSFIFTPVRQVKGETQQVRFFKKAADDLFSFAVSSKRQPIESFFQWLIHKTDIQNASNVRNTQGLLLHIFGAIATACCFWCF